MDGVEQWLSACQSGDIQFVRRNIDKYRARVNSLSESGLMLAAYTNQIEIVRTLLHLEYTLGNADGYTALMYAVCANNIEICELLKEREYRYVLKNGTTALMLAVQYGYVQIVELLCPYSDFMRNENNETALLQAVKAGRLAIVKKLIEKSQSITAEDVRCAATCAKEMKQQAIFLFLESVVSSIPETRPTQSIMSRTPKIMNPTADSPVVKKTKIQEHIEHISNRTLKPNGIIAGINRRAASKRKWRLRNEAEQQELTLGSTVDNVSTPQASLECVIGDIPASPSIIKESRQWLKKSWSVTINTITRSWSSTKRLLAKVFIRRTLSSDTIANIPVPNSTKVLPI